MRKTLWIFFTLLLFAVGCSRPTPETPTLTPELTPTLADPSIRTTHTPEPAAAARAYLDAWKAGDTEAMYAMLTLISRDAISLEDFQSRYQNVAAEAARD